MTEAQLIQACQQNDRRAQKALVDRYAPTLYTVARRYMRDEPSAKDVLQEALILIFKNIKSYKPKGSFEGWMRRIVVNSALKYLRDKDFQKGLVSVDHLSEHQTLPEIYQQLSTEEIIQLIQSMPDRFRQVFNLYIIEGYDHNEIASMLGISAGTSRSQLTRARQWLQARLQYLKTLAL